VAPSLIPRERRFYAIFEQQATCMAEAVQVLRTAFNDIGRLSEYQGKIKDIEHAGDELAHEVVRLINRTFVTPFDREDIFALSSGLDDILDYVDEIAETFMLYGIDAVPPAANEMVRLLAQAIGQLQKAIGKLEARKGVDEHEIEVHRIENLGDDASRLAIAELFSGAHDPLTVIKLKDVYELLENALDRCEDLAVAIENIIIKNA
jgi:uncharacterized protein Yka (UPF0111/DUF47 family)